MPPLISLCTLTIDNDIISLCTMISSDIIVPVDKDRVTHTSVEGTVVNSAYYGEGNVIDEFMGAATNLFGASCLLQV